MMLDEYQLLTTMRSLEKGSFWPLLDVACKNHNGVPCVYVLRAPLFSCLVSSILTSVYNIIFILVLLFLLPLSLIPGEKND